MQSGAIQQQRHTQTERHDNIEKSNATSRAPIQDVLKNTEGTYDEKTNEINTVALKENFAVDDQSQEQHQNKKTANSIDSQDRTMEDQRNSDNVKTSKNTLDIEAGKFIPHSDEHLQENEKIADNKEGLDLKKEDTTNSKDMKSDTEKSKSEDGNLVLETDTELPSVTEKSKDNQEEGENGQNPDNAAVGVGHNNLNDESSQKTVTTSENHDENETSAIPKVEVSISKDTERCNSTMVGEIKKDNYETGTNEKSRDRMKPQTPKRLVAVRKLEPITSHIRMEEIQWQKLLERRLTRENQGKEIEQRYKNDIKTQYRNLEKQKKTHNLTLKRRMEEFEKKRRTNSIFFCRMLQKKDREYQIENNALQQRVIEIEKQKQRNVNKLRARVNYFEEKKQKEQELFLHRMQELEKQREEEYEASQKRLQEIEKKKYNERKAWLLHVQKVEGLKKELFKKSINSLNESVPITGHARTEALHKEISPRDYRFIQQNIKDQARVMESVTAYPSSIPHLPKIHKRQVAKQKKNSHTTSLTHNTENEASVNASAQKSMDENHSDDKRLDVVVSN